MMALYMDKSLLSFVVDIVLLVDVFVLLVDVFVSVVIVVESFESFSCETMGSCRASGFDVDK